MNAEQIEAACDEIADLCAEVFENEPSETPNADRLFQIAALSMLIKDLIHL